MCQPMADEQNAETYSETVLHTNPSERVKPIATQRRLWSILLELTTDADELAVSGA